MIVKNILYKVYFIFILFFTLNISAFNGYLSIDKRVTDASWDFLPSTNTSFKYSDSLNSEIFLYHNNFGIKFNQSIFSLDLERSVQPKKLNLTADTNSVGFYYIQDDQNASYSLTFSEQSADRQIIDCYSFSSIVIGICPEANIRISNNKPKYDILDDSLMLVDGMNQSLSFEFTKAIDSFLLDEYALFIMVTENKFNWISPVEEITSGFIGNLTFNGSRLGDLINTTLRTLPQREKWFTTSLGLELNKSILLFDNFSFFLNPTLIFVKQHDYENLNKIPNYNLSIRSGLNYNISNFDINFYGSFYINNLYGFENITFNQRSEHHFDKNFGLIGSSLTYKF
tara:strand:- start:68 stop:1090 length:1023 start_codon:yes stop_codon:yes gene_type:complete